MDNWNQHEERARLESYWSGSQHECMWNTAYVLWNIMHDISDVPTQTKESDGTPQSLWIINSNF